MSASDCWHALSYFYPHAQGGARSSTQVSFYFHKLLTLSLLQSLILRIWSDAFQKLSSNTIPDGDSLDIAQGILFWGERARSDANHLMGRPRRGDPTAADDSANEQDGIENHADTLHNAIKPVGAPLRGRPSQQSIPSRHTLLYSGVSNKSPPGMLSTCDAFKP